MKSEALLVKIVQDEGTVLYKNLSLEDTITVNNSFVLNPKESMTLPAYVPHQHQYTCECGREHEDDDNYLEDW